MCGKALGDHLSHSCSLALFAILLLAGSAKADLPGSKILSPKYPIPNDLSQIMHEENEVQVMISNMGPIGQNLLTGNGAGLWPAGTNNAYLFGTGIWIGGIADVDGNGNPDTVTVIGYDPSSGATEFKEGRAGQNPMSPLARVFDSRDSTDLAEWPDEFSNQFGDPIVFSQQDLVTLYNDISGISFGLNQLGVQVNQRSMAFTGNVAGTSVHAIFFNWFVVNVSDSLPDGPFTIEGMYVGYCGDIDIGPSATDDMTSFIPVFVDGAGDTVQLNTAVVWDRNFTEVGFSGEVGLLGFSFDEEGLPGTQVNYTFMTNPSNNEPRPDPESDGDVEQYNVLACLGGACEEHNVATDIRFVLSIGPIDLAPGELQSYRGVLFFADPFAEPTGLEMSGSPIRVDPYQQGMANFMQVALEMKEAFRGGPSPSPFSIFRTSVHEETADTVGPYTIYTGITDSIGIKDVTLHYSIDGGLTFIPVVMSGSAILNYAGEIPGQPSGTTVLYYVGAVDSADVTLTDPPDAPGTVYSFDVVVPTGIGTDEPSGPGLPTALALNQNYPNPFNPRTVITFSVPDGQRGERRAVLDIFDTRGRRVRSLFDGYVEPGTYQVAWDGVGDAGERMGSGIYFYRLSVDKRSITRKMVLLK